MLLYEKKKRKNSTIGDGHPDSKFANVLGALHEYEICYKYKKNTFENIKK